MINGQVCRSSTSRCYFSSVEMSNFIRVDLMEHREVRRIVVYSGKRSDEFIGRKVTAGNHTDSTLNPVVAQFINFQPMFPYSFNLKPPMSVRYIIGPSSNTIHACEIMVFYVNIIIVHYFDQ